MLARCESLLASVIEQERQGEQALSARRDEAASRLQAASFAGRARGGYQTAAPCDVHQIDLSSDS
jgi:hypothetical protein